MWLGEPAVGQQTRPESRACRKHGVSRRAWTDRHTRHKTAFETCGRTAAATAPSPRRPFELTQALAGSWDGSASYLCACCASCCYRTVTTKAPSREYCCVTERVARKGICFRLGPQEVLGFLTRLPQALPGRGIQKRRIDVEPALQCLIICAADLSAPVCGCSRGMCVWPALGSGGDDVCDILGCCLWWILNCSPRRSSAHGALLSLPCC